MLVPSTSVLVFTETNVGAIRAQILKEDIADITEDYTGSIVFLNLSAPVEAYN